MQGWLSQAHLIGIEGLRGYGKSALANRLYETQVGSGGHRGTARFDQKIWVTLGQPYPFCELGRWLLEQLGMRLAETVSEQVLIEALVDQLSAQPTLVVWDQLETLLHPNGAWHVPGYGLFLRQWLERGRNTVLLLTTRDRPQLPTESLHWCQLSGLLPPAGEQLLRDRGIQGKTADLQRFVTLAGGHPLLLNLAASLLLEQLGDQPVLTRETQDLSWVEIIGHHPNDLEASLRQLFSNSWAQLPPPQQQWLLALTVYRLPFTVEAARAQQPAGMAASTEQDLQQLVQCSMLQEVVQEAVPAAKRFRVQPLLESVLPMQTEDLTRSHRRAIAYYWAHRQAEADCHTVADLAEYLETFHHYCQLQHYAQAHLALKSSQQAIVITQEMDDRIGQATALIELGQAYRGLGRYPQAIDAHQQSLAMMHKLGERSGEITSLVGLGHTYHALGQYPRAINFHQQALKLQRETGDRYGEAGSLKDLTYAYQSCGRVQDAFAATLQAEKILQALDCPRNPKPYFWWLQPLMRAGRV